MKDMKDMIGLKIDLKVEAAPNSLAERLTRKVAAKKIDSVTFHAQAQDLYHAIKIQWSNGTMWIFPDESIMLMDDNKMGQVQIIGTSRGYTYKELFAQLEGGG